MRLWPMIRRFGLLLGFTLWNHCRQNGHQWFSIGNSYVLSSQTYQSGSSVTRLKVKMRCSCCESIKLIELTVYRYVDGPTVVTSPSGPIKIV